MHSKDWRHLDGPVIAHYNFWRDPVRFDSIVEALHYHERYSYCTPRVRHYTDSYGLIIPEWKIEEIKRQHPYVRGWRRPKTFEFRNGPVENIHCYRGGTHYYRRIATRAEIRENEFLWFDDDAIEYGIQPRPARRIHNLQDAWDEIPFARRGKNWKHFRRTQYK